MLVKVKRLSDNAVIPSFAHEGDAGADLYATEQVFIHPGDWACIPTGLSFEIPNGYEMQIRPRSGLAAKCGVTVLNAPGTIDTGYRGEVKVILINHSRKTFTVNPGDRIAQAVVKRVEEITFGEVFNLPKSDRGNGGFGSTGV